MGERIALVVVALLGVALLALPAAAQDPDPYGEVLPGDATQPGEVTASPTAAPTVAVRPTPPPVAAPGQLARTGGQSLALLLVVGTGLVAVGSGSVAVTRRRRHGAD